MTNYPSFSIVNDTLVDMYIIHEPECFEFILPPNEKVFIEVKNVKDSIEIRHSIDNGHLYVRLLDDKSFYKVYYNNKDVFEKYMDR